jgi:hypothetical protein
MELVNSLPCIMVRRWLGDERRQEREARDEDECCVVPGCIDTCMQRDASAISL